MLKPLLTAALSKITSPNYSPQVEDLWSIYDIFPTLKLGSTESVLEEGLYLDRDTPFNLDEPVAVLHSSGSTGLPKAVFQTHKIVLQWASSSTFPLSTGAMSQFNKGMYRLLYRRQETRIALGRRRTSDSACHGIYHAGHRSPW